MKMTRHLRHFIVILVYYGVIQGGPFTTHATSSRMNVTTVAGSTVLLPCNLTDHNLTVTWFRPHNRMMVTRDDQQTNGHQMKADSSLLVKYVNYPRDQGEWICSSAYGVRQIVNLIVLAPPADRLPVVTPDSVREIDLSQESWTFTCTAHFAYPPVELSWIKVTVNDLDFDVTPPITVVSPMKTVASSIRLLLSPQHAGNVFACEARHPGFLGRIYTKEISYSVPQKLQAMAMAQRDKSGAATIEGGSVNSSSLSNVDRAIVITLSLLFAFVSVSIAVLVKTRRSWKLNVKVDDTRPMETSDEPNGDCLGNDRVTRTAGRKEFVRRETRRCTCHVLMAAILSVVLLTCLSLSIPIYLKGITIPTPGTDAVTSTLAGSALWLDCSRMTEPVSSLVQVTWRKGVHVFYHQYVVSDRNVGIPHNSTLGMTFAWRVTSQRPGQINIWPMLPEESDVYTCEVAQLVNNEGRTAIRRITTMVYITMGPVKNWFLLVLLSASAVCIVLAVLQLCVRSIVCVPRVKSHSPPVENDQPLTDSHC